MSTYANLPAPSPEQGLNRYLQEIRKFPMLEPEEEYMLAKRWVDHEDAAAAHRMVTSHLRLAAKIVVAEVNITIVSVATNTRRTAISFS